MLSIVLDYASTGYEVFPLRGKVPMIAGGRGVLDATADLEQIEEWWLRWPAANIGGRVPASLFVLDVDPRNGGEDSFRKLADEYEHGDLPDTRMSYSGRGDGGRHYWFRHPGGQLVSTNLGDGLDIKTHAGYVVLPPSIHPDSRKPYRWAEPVLEPLTPPAWLVGLLRPAVPERTSLRRPGLGGETIADRLSWADILEPEGWRCLTPDPDAEGARWRHPRATSLVSATIRHGKLFVYSPNTPFAVTEAGYPTGYTKLRAYATLHHRGDCSAAWRDLSHKEVA